MRLRIKYLIWCFRFRLFRPVCKDWRGGMISINGGPRRKINWWDRAWAWGGWARRINNAVDICALSVLDKMDLLENANSISMRVIMENKSSQGGRIDNTPADGATPMIKAAPGPGNYAETDGTNRYQFGSGKGYEGPGVGKSRTMNSDDQMPGPTYG